MPDIPPYRDRNHFQPPISYYEYPLPIPDKRILYLEHKRVPNTQDNINVSASDAIAVATSSNQANYCLYAQGQARPVMFYLVKYLLKPKTDITNCLSALYAADKFVRSHESRASDASEPRRQAQFLLARTLNNISGKEEYSLSMASASLLSWKMYQSTHDDWYLFIRPLIMDVKQRMRQQGENLHTLLDEDFGNPIGDGPRGMENTWREVLNADDNREIIENENDEGTE